MFTYIKLYYNYENIILWGDVMAEEKENKSVVTTYRLKEGTKADIKKQLDSLGLTQEQYFSKVVSLMEMENVKKNSMFAVNAAELQQLTDRIYNLFIGLCDQGNSFLSNKNVENEELKKKYKDMLFDKENSITKLNEQLQQVYSDLDVIQNENEKHKSELDSIRLKNAEQVQQLQSNLEDKSSLINEYKTKNDDLLSIVSEYKEYKTKAEEYTKLLADAQAKNIEKDNIIKNNEFSISELNKAIENLKQDSQKQMDQQKKEYELEKKIAVTDVREEFNNKLNMQQEKHNKEIEEYQVTYKSLLEELEKERASHSSKNRASNTPNKSHTNIKK